MVVVKVAPSSDSLEPCMRGGHTAKEQQREASSDFEYV